MTDEQKKIKRREYMREWYQRKKQDPEWLAKKNASQRKYLAEHQEWYRNYVATSHAKRLRSDATLRYYYKNREQVLARQAAYARRMTDEQRAKINERRREYARRKSAVKRMERANRELMAKAQSVAGELSKLFEQWDR